MIKLPKEVSRIMKTLESKGYEVYAVGGCVRDSLLGKNPLDFDLATNAALDEMKALFPEAKVISEKYSVIRFDYCNQNNEDEGIIVDLAAFRIDGEYSDYRRPDEVIFTDSIEEDLTRRDFTVNAMADNPQKTLLDPYGGRDDLKKKLICTVGDPQIRFREDPLRMLRAVRFAAQLDFDLHKSTYEAVSECSDLLEHISKDAIRSEFEKIIVTENTGKGLQLLANCGLMSHIVGEDIAGKLNRREMDNLQGLIDGIDNTFRVLERRLGVFYSCFENKRAEQAVEFLGFDNKTKEMMLDAIHLRDTIFFFSNEVDLKDFLARYGRERYDYLHNLAKASCLIYDRSNIKIQSRNLMMKKIEDAGDPIYVEDLAINGQDIINEGIAEGKKVGELLLMLTDVVHRKPKENTREA
ncbi:MAG: hypothetical protein HFG67_02535 [Firmicutes bacterium]|nr:hypothetical protein [Bacillota bacterium]